MPERSGNSKITTRSMLLMTTVCSGGFLFGYDIGVISGCLIMPDFSEYLPTLSPHRGQLVTSRCCKWLTRTICLSLSSTLWRADCHRLCASTGNSSPYHCTSRSRHIFWISLSSTSVGLLWPTEVHDLLVHPLCGWCSRSNRHKHRSRADPNWTTHCWSERRCALRTLPALPW